MVQVWKLLIMKYTLYIQCSMILLSAEHQVVHVLEGNV